MEVTASPTTSASPGSTYRSGSAASTQLGCGRDIDEVWDNITNPPTPHELGCPYCRAARSDLAELNTATRDLYKQDTTDPDLQASPKVLDRILAIARAEVRRGRGLPLDRVEPGRASDLTVSEQTVTALIRRTGDRTENIQIRRCGIELDNDEHGPTPAGDATNLVGQDPSQLPSSQVRVSLKVSAGKAAPIVSAVNELRQAIIEVVGREVGLITTRVDITVEDLHDA